MALYQNGHFIEDSWKTLEAGQDIPPSGHVIVPLDWWQAQRGAFTGSNVPIGVRIEPGTKIESFAQESSLSPFPNFRMAAPFQPRNYCASAMALRANCARLAIFCSINCKCWRAAALIHSRSRTAQLCKPCKRDAPKASRAFINPAFCQRLRPAHDLGCASRADQSGGFYQTPVLGMDSQGSCGGSGSPSCSNSIEIASGERTKAICPSRGGRLIVTPPLCRRAQSS